MLNTITESLDGMSEELQALYQKADNGYVLKLSGIDDHPDVSGLKKAYQAEKEKRKEAESRLKQIPDDFDIDQWRNVKTGKAKEEDLIALRKQLESERDEWRTKAQQLEQQAYKLTVSQQLDEALKSSGIVNPVYQKAARALLSETIQLKDGKPIVETDMGPVALAEHVKRWTASEGAAFVEQAKGGGANGGKSMSSAKSLTEMAEHERVELYRRDPNEYRRLRDQAANGG